MTTVWVLIVTCLIYHPYIVNTVTIHSDTIVFKNADRCVRNIENVKKQFSKYDEVNVECVERKLYGKK